jgi:DNA topoisomerase-1
MWAKGLKGTSAGRVQSVALKYISDLEKEINSFKSDEYWKATLKGDGFLAELSTIDGTAYNPKTKAGADAMKKDILSGASTAKVSEYSKKVRSRSPEPPFITSTLQQAASNSFGWNAKKTMEIAQTLFSSGLITYLRSDSTRIEPDKINSIREKVEAKLGANYLSPTPRAHSNKDAAQDAHEAIRPTYDQSLAPLSPDETKLLDLIDRRFQASQMADAQFDQASLKIEIKSEKHTYIFKANGSIMTFEGFLKVYGDNKEDIVLPQMSTGSSVKVLDIISSQHFTQPPGRYSDASLIKKLEKEGVGRPSTYASIIETLINRGYTIRDKKAIRATELGIMVSDFLSKSFPMLVSPEMTAKMESDLDEIASGKGNYLKIMSDFYQKLTLSISSAKKITSIDAFKTDRNCPECNSVLVKKKGDSDIFLSCSAYPKCGYTVKNGIDGKEIVEFESTGEACPDCGGILKERKSKFGSTFFGCGNYPSCTYIKKDPSSTKERAEITDVKCTRCKNSFMKKIKKKDGSYFLGCSSYPECKITMNLDSDGNVVKYKSYQSSNK